MAHVFRIHNGASNDGWFASSAPTSQDLDQLATKGTQVASSIPSPFAQWDLVKSAFQWVANHELKGGTAQHKLVSDTLDVAQLFFMTPNYSQLKISAWAPNTNLSQLTNSTNHNHSEFGKTLESYWLQDGLVYNFNKVRRLFFITVNGHIVGSTSPATLFSPIPDVQKLDLNITITGDTLFDKIYTPLYQRDPSFILYMFALSKQPEFATKFREVNEYLSETVKLLPDELQETISNYTSKTLAQYPPCHVLNNKTDHCEILDIPLGVIPDKTSSIKEDSDFLINSDFEVKGNPPLVLPNEKFYHKWTYTSLGVPWNSEITVPDKNEENFDDSILPGQNGKYPWLSAGNFLENKIIELPYEIDSDNFITHNGSKYLLPVKPAFFEYFEAEKLKEWLKIEMLAGGGISVKLNIPVRKGNITLSKIFQSEDIFHLPVHLAIMPFVKVKDPQTNYTLGLLIDDVNTNRTYDISFEGFSKDEKIDVSEPVYRSNGDGVVKSAYFQTDSSFDALQIMDSKSGVKGFIIPKMKNYSRGTDEISFAVDFGTTNTHIEYQVNNHQPKAFKNYENPIWRSLIKRKKGNNKSLSLANERYFEQELMPFQFGDNFRGFPLRSALVENKDINFLTEVKPFFHLNNYMLLEETKPAPHLRTQTNLKWSNIGADENKKRIQAYINNTLRIIFYKVLIEGGDLSRVKIKWFYPSTMTPFQIETLRSVWKNQFQFVFGYPANKNNLIHIIESTAPFVFYNQKRAVEGLSVSLDIGGGTFDMAIFEKGTQPKLISSAKFGADAVTGDGYGGSPAVNGFVNYFRETSTKYLKENNEDISQILNEILENQGNSSDFSNLLFNFEKRTNGSVFNYSEKIRESKFLNLPFLIYYSAIFYYISKMMDSEKLGMPRNILLSGNGSKSLAILDDSDNKTRAGQLFTHIFNNISNEKSDDKKVVFQVSEFPKEITSKGGLLCKESDESEPKFWVGGNLTQKWNNIISMYEPDDLITYEEAERNAVKEIEAAVDDFFEIMDNYFQKVKIEENFGISPIAYETFKSFRKDSFAEDFARGIREKKSDLNNQSDSLNETLFFYPLTGMLNKLTFELSKTAKEQSDFQ